MQPGEGTFDHPACPAEAAAVRRAALRELRRDAAVFELVAVRLRIVAAVALDESWFVDGPTGAASEDRHCIDEGQQLGHVVPVRRRQRRDERNPMAVGENMMFRPGLAAIGRVRSSFFPPRNARTDALSISRPACTSRSGYSGRKNDYGTPSYARQMV